MRPLSFLAGERNHYFAQWPSSFGALRWTMLAIILPAPLPSPKFGLKIIGVIRADGGLILWRGIGYAAWKHRAIHEKTPPKASP